MANAFLEANKIYEEYCGCKLDELLAAYCKYDELLSKERQGNDRHKQEVYEIVRNFLAVLITDRILPEYGYYPVYSAGTGDTNIRTWENVKK